MVSCFTGKPLLSVICVKHDQVDVSDVKQQIEASYVSENGRIKVNVEGHS